MNEPDVVFFPTSARAESSDVASFCGDVASDWPEQSSPVDASGSPDAGCKTTNLRIHKKQTKTAEHTNLVYSLCFFHASVFAGKKMWSRAALVNEGRMEKHFGISTMILCLIHSTRSSRSGNFSKTSKFCCRTFSMPRRNRNWCMYCVAKANTKINQTTKNQ